MNPINSKIDTIKFKLISHKAIMTDFSCIFFLLDMSLKMNNILKNGDETKTAKKI